MTATSAPPERVAFLAAQYERAVSVYGRRIESAPISLGDDPATWPDPATLRGPVVRAGRATAKSSGTVEMPAKPCAQGHTAFRFYSRWRVRDQRLETFRSCIECGKARYRARRMVSRGVAS